MKINLYKLYLKKIIVPVITTCKKQAAILSNIFSANNHADPFKEETLIQYKTGITHTPGVRCNNTLTTTGTNNISDDAKLSDALFLFIQIPLYTLTNSFMKKRIRSLLLTLFAITLTSVTAFSQTATIATDQLDYAPGYTVVITGTGFQPSEIVTIQVVHYDGNGDNTSPAHQPDTTLANADGNVNKIWLVPPDQDESGATLLLTADGQTSGLHAQAIFTDASFTLDNAGLTAATPAVIVYVN
jgi:hypothetical protein